MANGNLISGAYAAAGGGIAGYGLAAARGLTGISEISSTVIGNLVQKRFKRFQKFADWELGRKEGTMTTPDYKRLEKDLRIRRDKFIWSGKKDREMLMRELHTEKSEKDKSDELKKQLAKYVNDNKSGLSNNWMASDQGESVLTALEGAPVYNEETDEWEYEILGDDGESTMMSSIDIAAMLKENLKDGGTQDLINTIVNSSANSADGSLPNDNGIFQYDQNYRNVKNQVVGRGNYKSMVNDPDILVDGRIFKEDLIEMIMDNTYGDLGIRDQKITRLDKKFGKEDGVTEGDAMIIAEKLLEDERLGKKYLTTYVTNHLERNWISDNTNAGNGTNVDDNDRQNSQYKPGPNNEGVYEIPGDKTWDYKLVDGKWMTRKKESEGNWIDISKNEKAVSKLKEQFPNASEGGGVTRGATYSLDDVNTTSAATNTVIRAYDYRVINGEWHFRKKGQDGEFQPFSKFEDKGASKAKLLNQKYPNALGGDVDDSYWSE